MDFAHGVFATGERAQGIVNEGAVQIDDSVNGHCTRRSMGPSPVDASSKTSSSFFSLMVAVGTCGVSAGDADILELVRFRDDGKLFLDEGLNVLIEDVLLLVRQLFEASIGAVEFLRFELVAEFLELGGEACASGMLSEDEFCSR